MQGVNRTFLKLLLGVVAVLVFAAGCGEPSSAVSMMRTLEQRRAQAIIEKALTQNGVNPRPGRTFKLEGGDSLREDFSVPSSPYGIAYITEDEATKLAKALPKRDIGSKLRLFRPNKSDIVLLLYQDNYKFDIGGKHSATALTAEKTLDRDVTDFVLHVVKQGAHRP